MTEPQRKVDDGNLDWDVDRDGRMKDYATDDEPVTTPWEG